MHRESQAEEMAGMVLFLCSDAASYVTRQTHLLAATFIGRLRSILTNVHKRGGAKP
jgi:NAD(P)-dependent dehydrogenase (short-subunit alcohol dehydrogenase family)